MKITDLEIIIISDVSERDGLGIEIFYLNRLIIDIFRDDSKKSKTVTIFDKSVPLEILEYAIEKFNSEIPDEFLEESPQK